MRRFPPPFGLPGRRRAVVMILSLWISMILAVIALSVAYELRVNMRLARWNQNRLAALGMARMGLAKAVIDLKNDRILSIADEKHMQSDSARDSWAVREDKTEVEADAEGSYTVVITDEESKFDLQAINPGNAVVLARLLTELGEFDPVDAQSIAYMAVDWQDPDTVPTGAAGENETEAWTEWAFEKFPEELPEGWRFRPKNDLMLSIEEILSLPGITRELLYGPPEPAEERERRRRRRDDEEEESTRLIDYLTVQSGRFVNVNTASKLMLSAIFAAALPAGEGSESMAEKFIAYREKLAESSEGRGVMLNLTQQLQEAGIPQEAVARINQILPLRTFSSFFTATSTGTFKGITRRITARVISPPVPEVFASDPSKPEQAGRRNDASRAQLRHRTFHVIDPSVRAVEITER